MNAKQRDEAKRLSRLATDKKVDARMLAQAVNDADVSNQLGKTFDKLPAEGSNALAAIKELMDKGEDSDWIESMIESAAPKDKPVQEVATVNVISCSDDSTPVSTNAYPDTPEGVKAAEQLFSQIVRKIDPKIADDELADALENGNYENTVFLAHSTPGTTFRLEDDR